MNILLSAYACEPNRGSEPGVGWNWAVELAKYNNVWVITRDNNRHVIEEYIERNPDYKKLNLNFIYVGLSKKMTFWKKGNKGIRLFYFIWQKKAEKVAFEWHKKVHFDLIQHITFVSYTQPSYMYKIGVPLIWGPVAGGENIPENIKINMNVKEWIEEKIRRLSQNIALLFPSIRITMKKSKYILVATEETGNKIPNKYSDKTIVIPAIGIERNPTLDRLNSLINEKKKIKIIMAGRLIYWKAFDIGINAFLKLLNNNSNIELHILGEGNKKALLNNIAKEHLGKNIFFEKPVEHDKIYEFYQKFDIFINTSLRDSGCMTMMEAMISGLPCIAIACGGPKVLLEKFPECQIEPTTYNECVNKIYKKLSELINDAEYRKKVAKEQQKYAQNEFLISNKIIKLQDIYII